CSSSFSVSDVSTPTATWPLSLHYALPISRFLDPAAAAPAPKLDDVSDQRPESLVLEDVRRQGGPLLGEVRESITSRLENGDSLAEAFNALPDALRRPVELFGLAYLASHGEIATDEGGVVHAVRPDGSTRAFTLPKMTGDAHE